MTGGWVQETIDEALVSPAVPRVFAHTGCGGWVLWRVNGGFCLSCGYGPVRSGDYAKPGEQPAEPAEAPPAAAERGAA